jgi:hypothetical protein
MLDKYPIIGWANMMYARYGHPVYLIGSALEKEDPNDIDILIILPDEQYKANFGDFNWTKIPHMSWHNKSKDWAKECGKQAAYVAKNCGILIDFKIKPKSESDKFFNRPMLRIDQCE